MQAITLNSIWYWLIMYIWGETQKWKILLCPDLTFSESNLSAVLTLSSLDELSSAKDIIIEFYLSISWWNEKINVDTLSFIFPFILLSQ